MILRKHAPDIARAGLAAGAAIVFVLGPMARVADAAPGVVNHQATIAHEAVISKETVVTTAFIAAYRGTSPSREDAIYDQAAKDEVHYVASTENASPNPGSGTNNGPHGIGLYLGILVFVIIADIVRRFRKGGGGGGPPLPPNFPFP